MVQRSSGRYSRCSRLLNLLLRVPDAIGTVSWIREWLRWVCWKDRRKEVRVLDLDGIDRGLRERLNVVLNVHACGNRCRRSIVRVMTRRLTAVMRGGSGAAPPAMASLARPAVGATAQPVVLTEPGCGRSVEVAQELLTRVGTAGLLAVVALLVLGAATGKTWCLSAGHGRVHDPEDLYEALLFLTLARAHSSGRADK